MSNTLRYDALLVRDLAAELNRSHAGARLEGAFLERDRLRVTLQFQPPKRNRAAPPSLQWQLHPAAGHITEPGSDDDIGGRVQLRTPSTIVRVHAPPDERILLFDLDAGDAPAGIARRIVLELITNQWNALAIGAEDRITAVLRERATRERKLRAGVPYLPPPPSTRPGAHAPLSVAEWLDELSGVPPGERLRAVLRFAYVSPMNAAAIMGDADVTANEAALLRAHSRYTALVWTAPRAPVLLQQGTTFQPYSVQLGAGKPMPSLFAAFAAAASAAAAVPIDENETEAALATIAARLESLQRRVERLSAEHSGAAAEAARIRHSADVLLTQLQRAPRGAVHVELQDFDGSALTVELDPRLDAARNAARLYDAARRRDRAAARIPTLLASAAAERSRLEALALRVQQGTTAADELAALRRRVAADRDRTRTLPYREYRTSRGTEVRVGRGARANDELTFRHASGTDIWLHARDVAGAHVILRWPHPDSNPAADDIAEAAVLAALYSRARTSGTVAVDWTRRKYVRKPRKSAPGAVIPERVRTVFVEPDATVEQRMRVND